MENCSNPSFLEVRDTESFFIPIYVEPAADVNAVVPPVPQIAAESEAGLEYIMANEDE